MTRTTNNTFVANGVQYKTEKAVSGSLQLSGVSSARCGVKISGLTLKTHQKKELDNTVLADESATVYIKEATMKLDGSLNIGGLIKGARDIWKGNIKCTDVSCGEDASPFNGDGKLECQLVMKGVEVSAIRKHLDYTEQHSDNDPQKRVISKDTLHESSGDVAADEIVLNGDLKSVGAMVAQLHQQLVETAVSSGECVEE